MTAPVSHFDLEPVDARLKVEIPGLVGRPIVEPLAGGASNLTYRLRYPDRDLVLRRAPPGQKARGAHDMVREARILRALRPAFPLVPEVLAAIDDPEVMDTPFFVMAYLDGVILRGDLAPEATLPRDQADALCEAFVAAWVRLHAVDVTAPGLAWLDRGEGYVTRQLEGWARRFGDARTPDVGSFEAVTGWLADHAPIDGGRCLIHNDFRLDNVVLDGDDATRIVGILDWELATVGCPLMDLGASLAYWVQADDAPAIRRLRLQPTDRPGMWTRRQLVDRYLALAGRSITDEAHAFYTVYGLFRLAAIAQQIYFRHYHGQFRNERFAGFGRVVNDLETRCRSLLGIG